MIKPTTGNNDHKSVGDFHTRMLEEISQWEQRRKSGRSKHPRYELPTELLDDLCARNSNRNHFATVLQLERLWFKQWTKRNPIQLKSVEIGGKKLSRPRKSEALRDLERWGHITVEKTPGKPPLVTLKWHPVVPT